MIYLVFNPRQPHCAKKILLVPSLKKKKKHNTKRKFRKVYDITILSDIQINFFGVLYPTLSELINHWSEKAVYAWWNASKFLENFENLGIYLVKK